MAQNGKKVDLHTHSSFSDGTYNVEKLLEEARQKKVDLFGISDHDIVKGVIYALEYLKQHNENFSFQFVPSIEWSVNTPWNKRIHMLGINIDPFNQTLQNRLTSLQKSREERIPKIIKKLNELGIDISIDDLDRSQIKGVYGRPHVARALIKKGYAKSLNEVFDKYLGQGKPAYVPKERLTLREAVSITHEAGGILVFAHPLLEFPPSTPLNEFQEFVENLVSYGLDGIEIYYNYQHINYTEPLAHYHERNQWLSEFCNKNDLIKTAGSDFHGDRGELGSLTMPLDDYNKLKQKLHL